MKYIQYTLVDNKTEVPVSQAPAKNGPKHPNGITPTFGVEDTYRSGVPTYFGIAEDTFTPADWMREVTEEEFYGQIKSEFRTRARKARKAVEQGGFTLPDETRIRTDIESQNRIASLVTTINNTTVTEVDFEASPGNWVTLTSPEVIAMGEAVAQHVQSCFTWCRGVHQTIDAATVLDDYLPIIQEINNFRNNSQ